MAIFGIIFEFRADKKSARRGIPADKLKWEQPYRRIGRECGIPDTPKSWVVSGDLPLIGCNRNHYVIAFFHDMW